MSDFQQIYTKWPNGGGKVGQYTNIAPNVFIDKDSVVSDRCELFGDARIVNSKLSGYTRVSGTAHVEDSRLSTLVQVLDQAKIIASDCSGDITVCDTSTLLGAQLQTAVGQQIRILRGSTLWSVQCAGALWIENAKIQNCELVSGVRIYGGEWTRSPRIMRSPYQFSLIESHYPENCIIGCWDRPMSQWLSMVGIFRLLGNKMPEYDAGIHAALAGYEKLSAEELNWIADAIERLDKGPFFGAKQESIAAD